MAEKYRDDFLDDAEALIASLVADNRDRSHAGSRQELARAFHSLKSGAAFLGWDEIENEAHVLEDDLHAEDTGIDWHGRLTLLSRLIETRRSEKPAIAPGEVRRASVRFDAADRGVLDDSRKRGENFYRLTCRIDPSEPMPHPRAYLLASKLETVYTLVKSDPPLEEGSADFSRPVFWLTTDLPVSHILRSVDVDLVEVEELAPLDYDDALRDRGGVEIPPDDSADPSATLVSIERPRLDAVESLAEELSWRLEDRAGSIEAELAAELERAVESLAVHEWDPFFQEMDRYVRRLAKRRRLAASFDGRSEGSSDRGSIETTGEILRQLIRNSIRHGIESPEARRAAGKEPEGRLSFSVQRQGPRYTCVYRDDGRGVDEAAVRSRYRELTAHRTGGEPELVDILTRPDFTLLDRADRDGGRGSGLDIVRHLIETSLGGRLTLENSPGKGLVFRWTLPEIRSRRPYLIFQSEGRKWAIPAGAVGRREALDTERVDATGQAYQAGGGLIRLVGPYGPLPPGGAGPYVLEIRHRRRRVALAVDDLVSEEPWAADDLRPADPASPWARAMVGGKEGIPVLSSAIVYSVDDISSP